MEALFAHGLVPDGHGSLAMSIVALIGMIVPFIVLGVVCWVFWRAHKRDEAERRRTAEWRNAHSS
jgi:hypothetical protein